MLSRLQILIDLLHSRGDAAIATHSSAMPGYPLATAMSFATDEHHRPILLISKLAEHTRNLAADAKASFLVTRDLGDGEMERVSLVGEVVPVDADALLVKRYLRFHPEAERFLQLGDFRFHRFEPNRVLIVGGFGRAGWFDGHRLLEVPHIPLDEEANLVNAARPSLPDGVTLLGLDTHGADLTVDGTRRRIAFGAAPVGSDMLPVVLEKALADWAA